MSCLRKMRVAVVGAGVFGLAIALGLARAGAIVKLVERDGEVNASSIAAGMLAPAFEAALDPLSHDHFDLFMRARDLWPEFLDGLGPVGFERCGAQMTAPAEVLEPLAVRMSADGARCEFTADGLFTPEDWRITPLRALAEMRSALRKLGGVERRKAVVRVTENTITGSDGAVYEADAVVLACGYGGLDLAPELAALIPIKGQLIRFEAGPLSGGPILRGKGGYVVPGQDGAAAGATMQAGLDDRTVDSDVSVRLLAPALDLAPQLSGLAFTAHAGVRPATPDGLPMIGKSAGGAWLATGARRNGWLLAPLAARLIASGLAGGGEDVRLTPARFTPC
ncbi:MAG: FAD-dependent oxidoreductase [Alphaproteobacteria bacterium]